jgi:hypothetical protein
MWTPVTMSSRADHLSGHLCPPCADAYRRVGSLGPTCVERAITAHLEATGRAQQALALTARLAGDNPPRLVAWATLSHRAVIGQKPPFPPSSRSWSHCRIPKA